MKCTARCCARFPNGKVHTGRTEEDASGLLFRVEEDARTGRLQLLAQSQLPPDWAILAAGDYLLPALADNPGIREVCCSSSPANCSPSACAPTPRNG